MKSVIQTEFLELPDQIPFKKVNALKIYEVKLLPNNNQFQLHIYKKCEDLPDEKDGYRIKRKIKDFQWLISRLLKQSPSNLIIPVLPNVGGFYWKKLQEITANLYKNKKAEISRQEQKQYICRIIKRFIQILGAVSLKNLYKFPGFVQSSLFTFLDEKYDMYNTAIFQASQQTITQKLSTKLNTGGKLLTHFMNYWKKKQSKYSLDQKIKNLSGLEIEIGEFVGQLQKYQNSLNDLSANFLNQKYELQQKNLQIYYVLSRCKHILDLITLIKYQMQSIMKRIEANQHGLQQRQIKQQIQKYIIIITTDQQYIEKQFMNVMKQFYRISILMPVELNFSDLYPTK